MFRLIDLFCGAGGFTRGFLDTERFKVVFANDYNADAVKTYCANFDPAKDHTYHADLADLLADPEFEVPKADVVIGGPPCQGFSLLNKKRKDDPRRGVLGEEVRRERRT